MEVGLLNFAAKMCAYSSGYERLEVNKVTAFEEQ
jgi:hypothetical protein